MTLKNISLLLIFLIGNIAYSQNIIQGKWGNQKTGYTVEIYSKGNRFYGKIIKTEGDKTGHVLLNDIVYNESTKRYNGEVKTQSGMTARCEIEFINKNSFKLKVKKLFIQKTEIFRRTEI